MPSSSSTTQAAVVGITTLFAVTLLYRNRTRASATRPKSSSSLQVDKDDSNNTMAVESALNNVVDDDDSTSEYEECIDTVEEHDKRMQSSWCLVSEGDTVYKYTTCEFYDALRSMCLEIPTTEEPFMVRGISYLTDRVKIQAKNPLFRLLHVEVLRHGDQRKDHIGSSTRGQQVLQEINENVKASDILILNFQLPGSPYLSIVLYWAYIRSTTDDDDDEFKEMWEKFKTDENFANARFKLIPRVIEGPWMVTQAIGVRPVLLGNKVKQRYFSSDNYFEIDVDLGSSYVAEKVVSMCRSYSKNICIDIGIVLQGEGLKELPEKLMASARFDKVDIELATEVI